MRCKGELVTFDPERAFGFIHSPEASPGRDVFVHLHNIADPPDEMRTGTWLEFEVEDSGRGPQAINALIVQEGPRMRKRGRLGGIIEDFDPEDGVGFVCAPGGRRVSVSASDVVRMDRTPYQGNRRLRNGVEIRYTLVDTRKGPIARQVTVMGVAEQRMRRR